MAKTPSKPRARGKSEAAKAAARAPSRAAPNRGRRRWISRPAKAARAEPARRRNEPAAAKAAMAAPKAARAAISQKGRRSAPTDRGLEPRTPGEIRLRRQRRRSHPLRPGASPSRRCPAHPRAARERPICGPRRGHARPEHRAGDRSRAARRWPLICCPRETGEIKTDARRAKSARWSRSIGRVAEYYMADPQRAFAAQAGAHQAVRRALGSTLHRLQGEQAPPVAAPDAERQALRRPAHGATIPYFDFIKQAYVLTTHWADDLVKRADELDPHDAHKAQFYLRQVTRGSVALELPRHQSRGLCARRSPRAARTWCAA